MAFSRYLTKAFLGLVAAGILVVGMAGCTKSNALGGWKATRPENPGTAEQLAGTAWEVQGSYILFQHDGTIGLVLATGGTTPMPETEWTIDRGIVTVMKGNERLFEATWDGNQLIANGYPARTLQQAVQEDQTR